MGARSSAAFTPSAMSGAQSRKALGLRRCEEEADDRERTCGAFRRIARAKPNGPASHVETDCDAIFGHKTQAYVGGFLCQREMRAATFDNEAELRGQGAKILGAREGCFEIASELACRCIRERAHHDVAMTFGGDALIEETELRKHVAHGGERLLREAAHLEIGPAGEVDRAIAEA